MQLRVLINSLPKSGTHLLAQAVNLCGFPEHFTGETIDDPARITPILLNYREARTAIAKLLPFPHDIATIAVGAILSYPVPVAVFHSWLAAVPKGRYILGHLPWTPFLSPLLAELNYRQVFILRDPRAVLVSLLSFILDSRNMPRRHFLEEDFRALMPERRLEFLITGGYAPIAGVTIPSFSEMYRAMIPWKNTPGCLFLRYEDLIGVGGGGDNNSQALAVTRLAQHLNCAPLSAEKIRAVYNPQSRTFRKGAIDGWRDELDDRSRSRIEEVCAPLLQELAPS